MAIGGIFVPILSAGAEREAALERHRRELRELREALDAAEADEAEVSRPLEQHRAEQADTQADEADLAGRLREAWNSQARFELFEDQAGEFRWRLLSGNDRIIADSGEGYADRDGAGSAVDRFRDYVPDADMLDIGRSTVEVYEDQAEQWRWRLRHRSGRILADSGAGYADRCGTWDGIESLKRNAPNADVETVGD